MLSVSILKSCENNDVAKSYAKVFFSNPAEWPAIIYVKYSRMK